MKSKVFRSKVSKLHLGLYFGLALILSSLSIFTFLRVDTIWSSIILLAVAIFCACIPIISYNIHYELAEDKLIAKWIFGTTEIEYSSIDGFQTYDLPISSIRRFGISMLGGRYSYGDLGKFYAIFGNRRGVLINANESSIYGGKLFISPKKSEEFLEELETRLE